MTGFTTLHYDGCLMIGKDRKKDTHLFKKKTAFKTITGFSCPQHSFPQISSTNHEGGAPSIFYRDK